MKDNEYINESESVDRLPGAAIDVSDDEKVSKKAVKEEVKTENNNRGTDYSDIN